MSFNVRSGEGQLPTFVTVLARLTTGLAAISPSVSAAQNTSVSVTNVPGVALAKINAVAQNHQIIEALNVPGLTLGALIADPDFATQVFATRPALAIGGSGFVHSVVAEDFVSDIGWAPSPGEWALVGSNSINDVKGPDPTSGNAIPSVGSYLFVWGNAVFIPPPYGGEVGEILYPPTGGHDSYDGNDQYLASLNTRQVSLYVPTYNPTSEYPSTTPNALSLLGEYSDGSPFPPHGFYQYDWFPRGAKGSHVIWGTYEVRDLPNSTAQSHSFDIDAKTWVRGPVMPRGGSHWATCYDPNRRVLWSFPYQDAGPLCRLDTDLNLVTYTSNNRSLAAPTGAVIDWRRDRFMLWHNGSFYYNDLSNPNVDSTRVITPNGPPSDCSLAYVEELDKIVAWAWENGRTVHTIDAGNLAAGWTTEGSSSSYTPVVTTNSNALNNGTRSKFRYVPRVGSIAGLTTMTIGLQAYRVVGTSAPATELEDWQARISGPGVVWHHNFDSAAEVNQFRWSAGFGNGNDPNDVDEPGILSWISDDGFAGGGCCQRIRLAGTAEHTSDWKRPFAPFASPGNGRSTDDPAANGTVTLRTWAPTSGGNQTTTFTHGYYGHADYHGGGSFDGTEFFIQVRVKIDPNRIAPGNPDEGKLFFFTLTSSDLQQQEIVTYSAWYAAGGDTSTSYFYLYRGGGPSLASDSPGVGTHGNQPGNAMGIVGDGVCRFDDNGGRLANCWQWPLGEWVTLLYRVRPGLDGNNDTLVEVFVAETGEYQYRRLWSQSGVDLEYNESFPFGINNFILSAFTNGLNVGTQFYHRMTQIIFSKNFIPCPKV